MILIVICVSLIIASIIFMTYGTYSLSKEKQKEDIFGIRNRLFIHNCYVVDERECIRIIVRAVIQSSVMDSDGRVSLDRENLVLLLKEKGAYGILDKEYLDKFCDLILTIREVS